MPTRYIQHKYNLQYAYQVDDLRLEMGCFRGGHKVINGGLGRFGHFKNVAKILFPNLQWHPWMTDKIETLCDDNEAVVQGGVIQRYHTWMGCATAAKTFDAALFAFIWWGCDPFKSIVVMTSTTGKMVRKRIWPVIQELHHGSQYGGRPYKIGHLVDSKTTLQAKKGDDKHAIFAIAVKDGETSRAVADIQGMHAPRVMVVIDEATDVPEAIMKACENLKKGCQEFILLRIGNPASRLDPLGIAGEPIGGWSTVNVEMDRWKTKQGICLHFDGYRSPNVKARKTLYPFLYTWEDYQFALKNRGENTIEAWKYDRGFPAPDGTSNTIFSETMVEKHDGRGKHIFHQKKTPIAALDSGFGGDKCILRFGELGDLTNDLMAIQLTESIEIQIQADSKEEAEYQIARRVMHECGLRDVKPNAFGLDSTGTGRGAAAVLATEWSRSIIKVEFGGAASLRPASLDDPRDSCDVYDRRVTELWYSCREFLQNDQLKGLNHEEIRQFCSRTYSIKGRKYCIETKDEYKLRLGRSPDDADAVSVLIEVARQLGATAGGTLKEDDEDREWDKIVQRQQQLQADYSEDYSEESFAT